MSNPEQTTTTDGDKAAATLGESVTQRIAEIAARIAALDCERTTLNRERYELARLVKAKATTAQ